MAVSLAHATIGAIQPIQVTRMINHEVSHTYQPQMKDWLDMLSSDRALVNLDLIAQNLNSQYLPSIIEEWAERSNEDPSAASVLDEDLAAEFLVEAFSQLIMEGKPWKKDLWPLLDLIGEQMKVRVFVTHLEADQAHDPSKSLSQRIMRVPSTILVPQPEILRRYIS